MSIPEYQDPSLSFQKMKRIRMGDKVLHEYQKKLLDIRDKYLSQTLDLNENIFFYMGDRIKLRFGQKSQPESPGLPPPDNLFACFKLFPDPFRFITSNEWRLYWNPNHEPDRDPHLDWRHLRFNVLPESKIKSLIIKIRADLAEFKDSFKSNKTKDRTFVADNSDDDCESSDASNE